MNEKTAVVLAGGGSLGAVQVGMLQALVEAQLDVEHLWVPSTVPISPATRAAQVSRNWPTFGAAWANETSSPSPCSARPNLYCDDVGTFSAMPVCAR